MKWFSVRQWFSRRPEGTTVDRQGRAHWEARYDLGSEVRDEFLDLAEEDAALRRAADQIGINVTCTNTGFVASVRAFDMNQKVIQYEYVTAESLQDLLWEAEKKLRVLARAQLELEGSKSPVGVSWGAR